MGTTATPAALDAVTTDAETSVPLWLANRLCDDTPCPSEGGEPRTEKTASEVHDVSGSAVIAVTVCVMTSVLKLAPVMTPSIAVLDVGPVSGIVGISFNRKLVFTTLFKFPPIESVLLLTISNAVISIRFNNSRSPPMKIIFKMFEFLPRALPIPSFFTFT